MLSYFHHLDFKKMANGKYPPSFIKMMKKKKRKRIRQMSIYQNIIEQYFNDAKRSI